MRIYLLCVVLLILEGRAASFADSTGWRVTPSPSAMLDSEIKQIGRVVCDEGGYETTAVGLRCKVCPKFTGNAGSDEGLEIGPAVRGRFTTNKAEGQWILDTNGCEAHVQNYGGAILLGPNERKQFVGTPAVALGNRLTPKPAAGPLAVLFYRPGYRLNDCLPFAGHDNRTLLVCNEFDVAQGEIIGHVSSMEISRRGISRWRLLRWYDNSDTDMPEVLSITPTGMHPVELDNGQPGLRIKLKVVEFERQAYQQATEMPGKSVNLIFRRQGQRFFATEKTQARLETIGMLTRKKLE